MTDKPKRKNAQPNLRRYGWFFGILALVLLIPFRTPENMELILWGYVFIFLGVGMITAKYVGSHGIRHLVSVLVLVCLILPSVQMIFIFKYEPWFSRGAVCESEKRGLLTLTTCGYSICNSTTDAYTKYPAKYITILEIPISILVEPIWHEGFLNDCVTH